ncbi:hypothetical protein M378DRAFT_18522, partial [Amanita muscaria Koide BX008]
MNQLGEKLLGERCLSGELVPEEGCLSGGLVPNDRCLSGELAPGCLSGKLVPNTCLSSELAGNDESSDGGRNTSEEDAVVGELFTGELESSLPTRAIVLRHANNNNRGEKIPGLCDGNISSPTWYDRCSEDDDDDGPGPLPPKWSRPFAKKNGPPVLPEIETSEGESLYEEINEKLSDWSRQEEMVTAQAVIVEVTPGPSKAPARNAQRSAKSKSVKTRIPASEKKKGVSPEERGPLYEKLKAATRGGRKEAGARRQKTPAFFTQGPEHFRRDESEKPDGGWFGKTTHGTESDSPNEATDSGGDDGNPPSSPSDSGFDDLSSSDSDEPAPAPRRRTTNKSAAGKIKDLKIPNPFKYDGSADLDLLDRWCFDVDNWRSLYGLNDNIAVRLMGGFMMEKASRFFMKHVVHERDRWTVRDVYDGLFDYCFPSHFKLELRQKMMSTIQGNDTTVRDYARELESMALRFPDVTEREVTLIFWRGIKQYLRLSLIEKGMDPERTSLDRLIKYAKRREEAMEAKRREEAAWKGKPDGRPWGRFANRTDGPQAAKFNDKDKKSDHKKDKDEKSEKKDSSEKGDSQRSRRPDRRKPTRSKLSKEERDRLRAEGRCFSCKDVGHESRNCPARRQAKAPDLQSGAMSLAAVDQRGQQARDVDLSVGMVLCAGDVDDDTMSEISVGLPNEEAPSIAPIDDGVIRGAYLEGVNGGSPEEYLHRMMCSYYNIPLENERIEVVRDGGAHGTHYEIYDWETDEHCRFPVGELDSIELSPEWILELADYQTNVAQHSGHWRCCDPNDPNNTHEHCALGWLTWGLRGLGRRHFGWKNIEGFDADVYGVDQGYLVCLDPGWTEITLTEEEIRAPDFTIQ